MPGLSRPPLSAMAANKSARATININYKDRGPITAPHHGWLTSPAKSHATVGQGKELPLHLIALILAHVGVAPRGTGGIRLCICC